MLKLTKHADRDVESRFRASYRAYYVAIHRYVVRLSGERAQAEDLTQEVFVRLWKELTTKTEPPNTRAWLFKVANNLAVSQFRVKTRALRFFLPSDAADTRPRLSDANVERDAARHEIIERALEQMPEPMRQCLLLHHEGLTGREIADVLGVKPSYVGTLVYRAHERFRRECEALGGRDGVLG